MPAARAFIDSNVLLYALIEDEPRKTKTARELLVETSPVVSPQVLLETTNVLVRRVGIGRFEAARLLRPFVDGEVVPATVQLVRESWRIADRYGFHIDDAMILASALASRCPVLYAEDLQHDQRIETIRVVDPFR